MDLAPGPAEACGELPTARLAGGSALVEPIVSPWATTFFRLVAGTASEVIIASPFLGAGPMGRLADILTGAGRPATPELRLITNLSVGNMLSGSLDVAALTDLARRLRSARITYLPGLHAKVYVFDGKTAIVTSGNLTEGGLSGNHEYGLLLRDAALVKTVRGDIIRYASLGTDVSADTLEAVTNAIGSIAVVQNQAEQQVGSRLRELLHQKTDDAKTELLKARAAGKTTHGILTDTVMYLLDTMGPLTTEEMHPLIQQLHPDLCDDSIDRVIGGVHFGKRWKHYVRNAQQALKRQGLIRLSDGQWRKT